MQVWFGDLIFGMFCLISQDPVHIFQNRFLCWNRELKPVDLSTINPKNKTNFFLSYKGGCRFLKLRTPQQKPLKIKNDILFLKTYMIYHNNYYQPLWKCDFFNFQPTLLIMLTLIQIVHDHEDHGKSDLILKVGCFHFSTHHNGQLKFNWHF